MDLAVKEIGRWRNEDLQLVGETIKLTCTAHIEPALLNALTGVLLELEEIIGMQLTNKFINHYQVPSWDVIVPALSKSILTKLVHLAFKKLTTPSPTGIRKYVVESYNSTFHGSNRSCLLTMSYSIMNHIGSSKQNQEWSQTVNFSYFLRLKNEARNHLQDAKSSRFGKYNEFMVLIAYHYE